MLGCYKKQNLCSGNQTDLLSHLASAKFEPVTRFEGVARYLYRYNIKTIGECKNGAYNSNSQLRTMETDYGVG